MKRFTVVTCLLVALAACQTTTDTNTRVGYSTGGMCMGGASCGGYR